MDYNKVFNTWLNFKDLDLSLRAELESIKDNEEEKIMRFSKDLEFGTGGLRGIMGAGSNNMNIYTVRRATAGLAKYLVDSGKSDKCVAIAYDSRNNSALFAKDTALVLAKHGVKAYLFDALRPTPELSFAVRKLKCAAGVVITASHNPKEYNGYKAYGEDGAQVINEAADAITKNMESIDPFSVLPMDEHEAMEKGLLIYISKEVDEAYYEVILAHSINKYYIKRANLKIIYTPFHGAGNIPVREIIKRCGNNLLVVPEQEMPDGNFPTVASPNPENFEGFALAIEKARQENANLIIGTDPDSDRVGVVIKNDDGEYIPLTGNQTGALLTEYMLSEMKKNGTLPKNAVVIKTVVTNEITRKITENYGVELIDVLTGFKFIAEKIREYENTKEKTYILGFEESYGYLPGTYVRDKDAVCASMLIIEMACRYALEGMTLYNGLNELYKKYGRFGEYGESRYFRGIDGMEKISKIMQSLRSNPPHSIAGSPVVSYKDIECGIEYDLKEGTEKPLELPKSNVLRYVTEDNTFLAFRPSGTEPKFKIYAGFFSDKHEEKTTAIKKTIEELIGGNK